MAFSTLMLTTSGKTLYAKAQQGKPLRFTRVGIGDGLLGSGSMVNRAGLISERLSLLIDAVQLTNSSTEAAVIVTLKNDGLAEGFYFREIALFAEDPDTHQELIYLYDNAGTDGEYIPDGKSGMRVAEHLKLMLALDSVNNVTFNGSGNPLYLSAEDIDDDIVSRRSLWSSQKIATLLEDLDYDPTGSAAEVEKKLGAHIARRDNPHQVTAQQVGAIPASQKGAAGGVAELDAGGKVLAAQLPGYVDDVLEYANQGAFPAQGEGGKIYVAQNTNKTYRWSGTAYVEIAQGIALGETAETAFRGDLGKTAYDHSQATGNPHKLTREELGACAKVAPVTVTVAVESWTGSGPWTQTVAVAGVTAADEHIGVFPVDMADGDARKLYKKAYNCLAAEAETVAGGVKLTCRDAKPEIAFQVKIKGVR